MEWRNALQFALDSLLDGDDLHNPGCVWPNARLLNVSNSGCELEVELRFLSGQRYSCIEPGDFISGSSTSWWQKFRQALAEVSDRQPPPMSIRIYGVVEAGALTDTSTSPTPKPLNALSYKTEWKHEPR